MRKNDKIFREITKIAGQVFGNGGGCAYLYGSQARGDASKGSDWDILVITDDDISPLVDSTEAFSRYVFPFAEAGWHLDAQITPIHFSRSQWEAQRDTAFFQCVTSEAIRL